MKVSDTGGMYLLLLYLYYTVTLECIYYPNWITPRHILHIYSTNCFLVANRNLATLTLRFTLVLFRFPEFWLKNCFVISWSTLTQLVVWGQLLLYSLQIVFYINSCEWCPSLQLLYCSKAGGESCQLTYNLRCLTRLGNVSKKLQLERFARTCRTF